MPFAGFDLVVSLCLFIISMPRVRPISSEVSPGLFDQAGALSRPMSPSRRIRAMRSRRSMACTKSPAEPTGPCRAHTHGRAALQLEGSSSRCRTRGNWPGGIRGSDRITDPQVSGLSALTGSLAPAYDHIGCLGVSNAAAQWCGRQFRLWGNTELAHAPGHVGCARPLDRPRRFQCGSVALAGRGQGGPAGTILAPLG